jgi:hypothetical protein
MLPRLYHGKKNWFQVYMKDVFNGHEKGLRETDIRNLYKMYCPSWQTLYTTALINIQPGSNPNFFTKFPLFTAYILTRGFDGTKFIDEVDNSYKSLDHSFIPGAENSNIGSGINSYSENILTQLGQVLAKSGVVDPKLLADPTIKFSSYGKLDLKKNENRIEFANIIFRSKYSELFNYNSILYSIDSKEYIVRKIRPMFTIPTVPTNNRSHNRSRVNKRSRNNGSNLKRSRTIRPKMSNRALNELATLSAKWSSHNAQNRK